MFGQMESIDVTGFLQEAGDVDTRSIPGSKSELNITLFSTLSHPSHCPICATDIMVTVLLLQVMEDGKVGQMVHLC